MAFGTWFKKLQNFGNMVKNFAEKKIIPAVARGSQFVHDKVVPIMETVGDKVGGNVGSAIKQIAKTAKTVTNITKDEGNIRRYAGGVRDAVLRPIYKDEESS